MLEYRTKRKVNSSNLPGDLNSDNFIKLPKFLEIEKLNTPEILICFSADMGFETFNRVNFRIKFVIF